MKKIKEISYFDLPFLQEVASYNVFGRQSDGVWKKDNGEYFIRIIKLLGLHSEWEYFELDPTGLITQSPRGLARFYNKKIRIINMEDMVTAYKGKIVNQKR